MLYIISIPGHDWTAVITTCGRICYQTRKINVSQVFAGQKVGVKQVDEHIWLVTFMHYDLGYFDDETCRLEPIDNPFGPKLLPMSPAQRLDSCRLLAQLISEARRQPIGDEAFFSGV